MSLVDDESSPAYQDALQAIQSRGRFGIRLGLGRTRALLRELGDPHLGLRGPLIGGTNGKGSVQAMVSAVLQATGQRVGQTPKPHLVSYRERIVVDGRPIAPADFAAVVGEVLGHAAAVARRHGDPTEFEILTAAAFTWFQRSTVDIAVVEVGLGGRLDATNAWDGGVAAITNVELDHTEWLGTTQLAIGREKAAIIKLGDMAVTAANGEGLRPIRRRAARLGVALRVVEPLPVLAMDRLGTTLAHPVLGEVRLGMLGRHQAANGAVAVAVLEALRDADIAAWDAPTLRRGLAGTRWPGRLELLQLERDGRSASADAEPVSTPGRPDLLLDGAHNPHGMRALAAALDELRARLSSGRLTLVCGIAADKDVPTMLRELVGADAMRGARIIATTMSSARAMPASTLAAAWRDALATAGGASTPTVAAVDDWEDALGEAIDHALADDGPLVVAGSLYLVGDVRGRLVGDRG